jgi:hypothetical protein
MMDNNRGPMAPARRGLCRTHEFLFALNIAFGVVLGRVFGYDRIFIPEFRLEQVIYYRWGLKWGGGAFSGYLAFATCVAALGVLLLLLTKLFSSSIARRYILVYAAGISAFGVAPVCSLYIHRRYGRGWYPAEIATYSVAVVLYIVQKWAMPVIATIGIASIHYGFWYLRFWAYGDNPLELVALLLGFCTCIAWIMYVPAPAARPAPGLG